MSEESETIEPEDIEETGELNLRQELFCHLWFAKKGNASAAYTAAGYETDNPDQAASRLLRNVKVKARIEELRKEYAEKLQEKVVVDIEYVEQGFVDIVEKCLQRRPIKVSADSDILQYNLFKDKETPEIIGPFNPTGAAAGLTGLARMKSMFEDNLTLKADQDIAAALLAARQREQEQAEGWEDESEGE